VASSDRQHLDDLLLSRATEGLSPAQARKLERLLAIHPEAHARGYERAAAAVCTAALRGARPMPKRLRERLERRAAQIVAGSLVGES